MKEMLRSRPNGDGTFNSNSYASRDAVNSLKWSTLEDAQYQQVYEYYKGLIAFRKAHGALRLSSAEDVAAHVTPVEGLSANVIAYDITGGVNEETAEEIFLVFNANTEETTVTLPEGEWNVYIDGEKAGTEVLSTITDGTVSVAPLSAMVLAREGAGAVGGHPAIFIILGCALVAVLAAFIVLFAVKRKK